MDVTVTVPRRFRGPAGSGNGGWTAGSLAGFLPGAPAVRVRLQAPPPLESPMAVAVRLGDGGRRTAQASVGEVVVAQALEVDASELDVPGTPDGAVPPIGFGDAEQAGASYPDAADHPFPECFACGPGRADGDGLRLRPGRSHGGSAAAWVPHASLAGAEGELPAPVVWAALDCPGGWAADIAGRPMVLGTMTAVVLRAPRVAERCVVTGAALGTTGRRWTTASALYGEAGDLLARAVHVWVAVDPATFGSGRP